MTEKLLSHLENIALWERPGHGGYLNALLTSFSQTFNTMLRRQRLILAAVVSFLPVLIPVMMAFFSLSSWEEDGRNVFIMMVEKVHINVLAPLLALFFATMLVGEDAEGQTMPYMLTRPIPRSSWVLGRFGAYLAIATTILCTSIALTFGGCTALSKLYFSQADLTLMLHYMGVAMAGLAGAGALTVMLGAMVKRPIVVSVVLLYGWQYAATAVPGLIDFFTIKKYVEALLPVMAEQRDNAQIIKILGSVNKELIYVAPMKALIMLCIIIAVFLGITILTVRWREYSAAKTLS